MKEEEGGGGRVMEGGRNYCKGKWQEGDQISCTHKQTNKTSTEKNFNYLDTHLNYLGNQGELPQVPPGLVQ